MKKAVNYLVPFMEKEKLDKFNDNDDGSGTFAKF
jgi:cobalamin-dependent methionine synthase I